MNSSGRKCAEEILDTVYCSVFIQLVILSCIKSTIYIMISNGVNGERVQITAIHRAMDLFTAQKLETIDHKKLKTKFQIYKDGISMETKFLHLQGGEPWPMKM